MIQAGTVLAGKYQVERVLGQGGMGCVVSAVHLQLGQRVAIKFLLPEALRVPDAVERFLREARAAVRLRSEHVGRVIDVGQFDDGAPYMVMEFLEGMDLANYLQRTGPLAVPAAVDFVMQGCEAIAEAHQLGIVHRDLKPANLFLTTRADGNPLIKVLDFGISKAAQADASFNLTRTTTVMGSPGYMSPEQLRSTRDCDARADVWSLGVILYELCTGRQPFGAESITELALKVAIDPTPPMRLAPDPPGFETVVGKCLSKDVKDRYQNVAELAAALVPFGPPSALESAQRVARVLQVSPSSLSYAQALPPRPGTTPGKPTTLSNAAGTVGTMSAPRRKTGMIIGLIVAAAVIGGTIAVVATGGGADKGEVKEAAKPEPPPVIAPDAGVEAAVVAPPDAGVAAVTVAPDAGAEIVAKDPPGPRNPPNPPKKKPPKKQPPKKGSDEDLSDSRY